MMKIKIKKTPEHIKIQNLAFGVFKNANWWKIWKNPNWRKNGIKYPSLVTTSNTKAVAFT